jgi:hypothetical protein
LLPAQQHLAPAYSNRCIFSLPGKATQSICTDLLGILKEILSYGIGGLFTQLNLFLLCLTGVYPVKSFLTLFNWGMPDMAGYIVSFCTSHFLIDSLNRAVLGGKLVD